MKVKKRLTEKQKLFRAYVIGCAAIEVPRLLFALGAQGPRWWSVLALFGVCLFGGFLVPYITWIVRSPTLRPEVQT